MAEVVVTAVVFNPVGVLQGGVSVVKLSIEENALRFEPPQSVCTCHSYKLDGESEEIFTELVAEEVVLHVGLPTMRY